ncbi:Mpp10 protein-domain-containing protein [Lobosporangium transversale]|uniref:Mpp10 protein-domain-containing protein n=1 Tax=Lobosporangium transversale TaxID=64571 RepID=A0A1Y2GHI8_9FUNG|nr:Mpp10 protein-domain-containing protein [Lobosporangium transversale]ORZ11037.1 Mpp10 protein-domain-containing protein [Lobosporangium transversale]|eukprot:XP_021879554.1 Mpp10 protein-domain-containing protein [Lobosporangium transversale]
MPDEALLKSFHDQVLARPESTESGSLKKHGSMLEELFIDGFDNDQIWEEIHMQNTPFLSYLKLELKNLKSNNQEHHRFSGEDDAENFDDMEPEDYQERGEDEDDDDDEEEEEEEEEDLDDLDLPTSEVDDDFFNLEEFNALTEKQEQDELEDKEPEDDDEEIDYFADPDVIESGDEDDDFGNMGENEDEADAHDVTYKDFFAPPPRGTTNRFKAQRPSKNNEDSFGKAENSDDLEMEDADEDDENAEINELGDRVSNLFGIDEAEDDEAEKLSKFEKQQRKLKAQIEALEQENVAAKDWTIKGEASSFRSSCQHEAYSCYHRRDNTDVRRHDQGTYLGCNWHYTPKPPKAELTVVTNAPAISMEEAIPVSVADAALLAPEEVYSAGKQPIKGDTEMEQADRKRKRAQAKKAKKVEIREKARKEAERKAEREARDRRLGRQPGDKGNSKTVVRDKMDAVKAFQRSSIKNGSSQAENSKGAKLKL